MLLRRGLDHDCSVYVMDRKRICLHNLPKLQKILLESTEDEPTAKGALEMNYQFTETGENGTPVSHGRHVPLAFTVENVEPRYGDIRVPSELVAH